MVVFQIHVSPRLPTQPFFLLRHLTPSLSAKTVTAESAGASLPSNGHSPLAPSVAPFRVILLDFGLSKCLSPAMRLAFAAMTHAAASVDMGLLLGAFQGMGLALNRFDPEEDMKNIRCGRHADTFRFLAFCVCAVLGAITSSITSRCRIAAVYGLRSIHCCSFLAARFESPLLFLWLVLVSRGSGSSFAMRPRAPKQARRPPRT